MVGMMLGAAQINEIRSWTKANYRARWEYYKHPFISPERAQKIEKCLKGCGRDVICDYMAAAHICRICLEEEMRAGLRGYPLE